MRTRAGAGEGKVPPTEDLYDRYLEACLAGDVEDPNEFCDRYGKTQSDLHTRVAELHRLFCERESKAADPNVSREVEAGLPFDQLGDFRLLRRLDAGGMGMILLAEQMSLGRLVALKIIRPELQDSATASERFRREAFAVARLRHPHIVRIHALGVDQGVRFLAMEFVEGRTLDELLRESEISGKAISTNRVIRWMAALARALAYAHDNGVIHRDIKPGNIRITPDDEPMILDFGVARDDRWEGQTLTQGFTGSPLYAAPEQLDSGSRSTDARADVYALGVTLYQCLTGKLPFRDESMERVFHRVLTEEPLPPRRVNAAVPRDLDVVTRKAMEKSPDRRYATAAEFADDLEAVLEFRPVRAKSPGALSRAYKWGRRHPATAAVVGTSVMALLGIVVLLVMQGVAEDRSRRTRAAQLVADAGHRVEHYRQRRESTKELEKEVMSLQKRMHAQYMSERQERLLTEKEDAVAEFQREREAVFHEVIELLRRARELDPDVDGTRAVRAELFAEKWQEATLAFDEPAAAYYRERVAELDPQGRLGARIGRYPAVIRTDPPGADVYLFHVRDQSKVVEGGEHRWVPFPGGGAKTPVPPGTWCLRVMRAAGNLEREDILTDVVGYPIRDTVFVLDGNEVAQPLDRLLSADGEAVRSLYDIEQFGHGGPAPEGETRLYEFERAGRRFTVHARSLESAGIRCGTPAEAAARPGTRVTRYRMGASQSIETPPGVVLRATAIPVFLTPACRIGKTPIERTITLDEGRYLFVLRMPGRETVRCAARLREGNHGLFATLPPRGHVPPGFLYIVSSVKAPRGYLIMDREVTSAEYLEFLNDPATLRRIRESGDPILFPRDARGTKPEGYWRRTDQGYGFGEDWHPDWPVLGVSWFDAKAYAAWRTERAQRAGKRIEFDLPGFNAWMSATGALNGRFQFGLRFRPKWIKSNYARPQAMPEPILRYPIDESIHGVSDMCGSASEWLDDWVDEARNVRRAAGGSWGHARPERFVTWGEGHAPESTGGTFGFRLVMRYLEDDD